MNTEYRRDTHHSYLVLYETEHIEKNSFQKRMFLENQIPGFLDCKMYQVNQSQHFYYDISSRQSLGSILEAGIMDIRLLEILLESLLRAMDGLQKYLLDINGFFLQPDCIFLDPSGNNFQFCYYPEGALLWKDQMRSLAEYLLPRLDHKNHTAVRLGYTLYRFAMEDKITEADLKRLLESKSGEDFPVEEKKRTEWSLDKEQENANTEGSERKFFQDVPENRDELLQAFFEEEGELPVNRPLIVFPDKVEHEESGGFYVKQWILTGIPLLLGGISAFILWYVALDVPALISAVLGITISLIIFLVQAKKGKERETESTMEQYAMVQDWLEEEKKEEKELQERQTESTKRNSHKSEDDLEEGVTCLLSSDAARKKLAYGYLVPDSVRQGQAIPIEKEVTMIGKSSQMDVVLRAIGVSRTHARILCKDGKCFLTDMNSRNGTCLNGLLLNPKEQQLLSDGDRILFADQGYEWKSFPLRKATVATDEDLWWNA